MDWGVLTTEYQMTKDIVRNYQSYCKTQAKNNNPTVEFTKSLKELLLNNVPDLQFVQNVQSGNITNFSHSVEENLEEKVTVRICQGFTHTCQRDG